MNKKNNQRFIDNDKKIEECYIRMLDTTDINQITVRSICQAANINRTTFYTHYQDVYDLQDKLQEKMNSRIMALYDINKLTGAFFTTPEYFLPFLNFIREHQSFYRACLNKRTSFPIKIGFEPLWNKAVKPIAIQNGIIAEEEMVYYFVFYQAGITMCLKRWVDHGCQEPAEQIYSYFLKCLPDLNIQKKI